MHDPTALGWTSVLSLEPVGDKDNSVVALEMRGSVRVAGGATDADVTGRTQPTRRIADGCNALT